MVYHARKKDTNLLNTGRMEATTVYEKSLCNEEGQIVFKNGTKISDRTCRCDYSRGYDFVVKPKDGCECIPSEEDCSCYHKTCQTGFILSPGESTFNLF
jgi:hypothetical protein